MSNEIDTNTVSANDVAAEPAYSPMPIGEKAFIFNRFYFDLLKKLKNSAKQKKDNSKEARNVLRAIKNSYSSYETGSVEHIQYFKDVMSDFLDKYYSTPVEDVDSLLSSEEASAAMFYNQISVSMVAASISDTILLHHYIGIFAILMLELSNDDITKALGMLKDMKGKDLTAELESIPNETARFRIQRLHLVYSHKVANVFSNQFSEIETTSIGKLAKEIMDEVDISKIQNSIGEDGDIFKAIADPNSGIASLLGTVSQKMITKLASGEIKQENLLEDAMKFATKLPGMMPGGGSGGMDLGNMASMMKNLMGGMGGMGGSNDDDDDDASTGFDMGSISKMLQGMMGGGKQKRPSPTDARAVSAYSAARAMSNNVRRSSAADKIRKKLEKRKAKENVYDLVEKK